MVSQTSEASQGLPSVLTLASRVRKDPVPEDQKKFELEGPKGEVVQLLSL